MPQGQQRRNNARGRIPSSTIPRQDMLWTVTSRDLFNVGITPTDGMDGLIIHGILRAEIVETGEVAIDTSNQGSYINIHFATVPAGESTIRIAANDPAVRNSSGGYLVGKDDAVNPPTPQPPSATLTGFHNAEAVMNFCTGGNNATLYVLLNTPQNHEFYLAPTEPYSTILAQVQSIGILFVAQPDELWSVLWNGTDWVGTQII